MQKTFNNSTYRSLKHTKKIKYNFNILKSLILKYEAIQNKLLSI